MPLWDHPVHRKIVEGWVATHRFLHTQLYWSGVSLLLLPETLKPSMQ